MKKYDRSIALFEELLKLERTKFRSDHPDTLETQAKLGVVYREAGRVSDALAQLEEVYEKGRQYRELRWVGNALLTAYVQAGRKPEAADLLKTRVEAARKEFPADSLKLAGALTDIGQALLDGKAHADAEPFLRESLSIRDKHAAAAWETDRARSVLGEALSGQKKYADAEPLLLSGYDGLKKQEAKLMHLGPSNLTNAMERLALLYEGWGKPDEATKWRKELQTVKLKVSGVRDQESGKQPK
jgi:tetratricopeptide (TPR) repeat protein